MNEEKIFEMIGCLDDEYLLESAPKSGIPVRRRRHFSALLAAAIAAASLLTVGGAAAAYKLLAHKGSVEQYGISGEAESRLIVGTSSAENDHLRLTADTVLSDGYTVNIIFTLEALDEQGREFLNRSDVLAEGLPVMFYSTKESAVKDRSALRTYTKTNTKLSGGAFDEDDSGKGRTLTSEGAFAFIVRHYFGSNNPGKIYVMPEDKALCSMERTDDPSVFDGIYLELDVGKNQEVREFTDGTNRLLLSSMNITLIPDGDISTAILKNSQNSETDFLLICKDGTEEIIHDQKGFTVYSNDYGYTYMRKAVDIDRVEKVIYWGIEFDPI